MRTFSITILRTYIYLSIITIQQKTTFEARLINNILIYILLEFSDG